MRGIISTIVLTLWATSIALADSPTNRFTEDKAFIESQIPLGEPSSALIPAEIVGISRLWLDFERMAEEGDASSPNFRSEWSDEKFERALAWADQIGSPAGTLRGDQSRMYFLASLGASVVADLSFAQVLAIARLLDAGKRAIENQAEIPESIDNMVYQYLRIRHCNLRGEQFVALLTLVAGERFFETLEKAFDRVLSFSGGPCKSVFELSKLARESPASQRKERSNLAFLWRLHAREGWTPEQRSAMEADISALAGAGVGVTSCAFVLGIDMKDPRRSTYISSFTEMTGMAATHESEIAEQILRAQNQKPPAKRNDRADWGKEE
jgi:hypothetical protein